VKVQLTVPSKDSRANVIFHYMPRSLILSPTSQKLYYLTDFCNPKKIGMPPIPEVLKIGKNVQRPRIGIPTVDNMQEQEL